ncbi:MAG: hypothetical protein ACJ78J_12045 [Gemmatimonadaceae bacterium]
MQYMQLRNVAPVVALLASNCMLLSGRCIYEIRSLQASGRVEENGVELVTAQITQAERRDSDPEKSTYWLVLGASLKSHVTSATLRNSADPARVMLTLPVFPSNQAQISEGYVSTNTGAALGGFWDVLGANTGVIQLETDLAAQPTVTIPLIVTQKQNWTRPYCS